MAGKTVLVTGGIGMATATSLAAVGARADVTGRDIARTRASADVARASGNPAVDPLPADMSSQAQVRLVGEALAAYPRLDAGQQRRQALVRTGFAAEDPPPIWKVLPLIRPFLKTPQKEAATSIYLADQPRLRRTHRLARRRS